MRMAKSSCDMSRHFRCRGSACPGGSVEGTCRREKNAVFRIPASSNYILRACGCVLTCQEGLALRRVYLEVNDLECSRRRRRALAICTHACLECCYRSDMLCNDVLTGVARRRGFLLYAPVSAGRKWRKRRHIAANLSSWKFGVRCRCCATMADSDSGVFLVCNL